MKDDVLEGNNDGQGTRESEHLLLHTMERKEEKVSNLYRMPRMMRSRGKEMLSTARCILKCGI